MKNYYTEFYVGFILILVAIAFLRIGLRYLNIASKKFTRIMHQSPEKYIQQKKKTTFINK